MSKAFDKIAAGLQDAIAHGKGSKAHAKTHKIEAVNVRSIRRGTGLTQDRFASVFHIPIGTLRNWEQGRRRPDGPAVALLRIIEREPETAVRVLRD